MWGHGTTKGREWARKDVFSSNWFPVCDVETSKYFFIVSYPIGRNTGLIELWTQKNWKSCIEISPNRNKLSSIILIVWMIWNWNVTIDSSSNPQATIRTLINFTQSWTVCGKEKSKNPWKIASDGELNTFVQFCTVLQFPKKFFVFSISSIFLFLQL